MSEVVCMRSPVCACMCVYSCVNSNLCKYSDISVYDLKFLNLCALSGGCKHGIFVISTSPFYICQEVPLLFSLVNAIDKTCNVPVVSLLITILTPSVTTVIVVMIVKIIMLLFVILVIFVNCFHSTIYHTAH